MAVPTFPDTPPTSEDMDVEPLSASSYCTDEDESEDEFEIPDIDETTVNYCPKPGSPDYMERYTAQSILHWTGCYTPGCPAHPDYKKEYTPKLLKRKAKKPKAQCTFCWKKGHVIEECQDKKDIEKKEQEHLKVLKEIREETAKKAKKIALYTCSYCHQKGHRKPQCHKQLKDTYVKLGLTQKEMARRLPVGSASVSTIDKELKDSELDNTDTTNTARSTIETLGVAGTTTTKAGDPQTGAAP